MPQGKLQEKSDSELVELSKKDQNCFSHLIQRYEERLLRYIIRVSSTSRENAEDILQNVFIKVYQNLNGFNPQYKFSSWIYRISHNETISFIRKNKNQPRVLDIEESDEFINSFASDFDLEREIDKKELAKEIRMVLSKMDEKYREVLILKFLEERDYEEISDILQKPLGTVGTLINRAKKQFREKAKEIGLQ